MNVPQIRVKTEGFRAINKADIIIDGITVVAGENGCGKSTLSKLLYHSFKISNDYDTIVEADLKKKIFHLDNFILTISHELDMIRKEGLAHENKIDRFNSIKNTFRVTSFSKADYYEMLDEIKNIFSNYSTEKKQDYLKIISRLNYILKDTLEKEGIKHNEIGSLPFDKIYKLIEFIFNDADLKNKERPSTLFNNALTKAFSNSALPKLFDVLEFDDEIIATNKKSLGIPYSIKNSIYIDSPMMLGLGKSTENEYWNELNELLSKKQTVFNSSLSNKISTEIIGGEVSLDESQFWNKSFQFKRSDGSVFDLMDCATGIKSFSIIQLLLKNGSLNDKTLLIIDEPESHLHPQWIIEYARLIVLLNKDFGVKFFIASHNPDMVSAIKYISEKEGVSEHLNFYLAEKSGSNFAYDYKHLGTEIGEIFESFNISYDRLKKYGV